MAGFGFPTTLVAHVPDPFGIAIENHMNGTIQVNIYLLLIYAIAGNVLIGYCMYTSIQFVFNWLL